MRVTDVERSPSHNTSHVPSFARSHRPRSSRDFMRINQGCRLYAFPGAEPAAPQCAANYASAHHLPIDLSAWMHTHRPVDAHRCKPP